MANFRFKLTICQIRNFLSRLGLNLLILVVDKDKARFVCFPRTVTESTLFVVLIIFKRFTLNSYIDNAENFLEMIGECVSKTLSLFPSARAFDFKYFVMFSGKGRNTLRNSTGVFARKDSDLTTMLDLLKKSAGKLWTSHQ